MLVVKERQVLRVKEKSWMKVLEFQSGKQRPILEPEQQEKPAPLYLHGSKYPPIFFNQSEKVNKSPIIWKNIDR